VDCFDHDGGAAGFEAGANGIGDLGRHGFLGLQAAGKNLNDTGQFGNTHHLFGGDTEPGGSFEQAAARLKFVLDCHLVAGDFDYMLKIRVSDMADFNRLHSATLIGLPGVRQTRTFFVMKEVVDNAPLDF